MKILITGASSYVGARFYADLARKHQVVGTYNSNKLFDELEQLDITKRDDVISFITQRRPQFIVHVAANASGSWCDTHPELAVALNELGTKYIVEGANLTNSKVILISSFAATNADQLYGRTKLKSEEYVKDAKSGYIILRPSLIVGYSPNTTNDRPFNRLLKNITEKTPAVYDSSWRFQPTWLKHLEEVIEEVIQQGIINQTIPVSVPEIKTRYDIANDVLPEFGVVVSAVDKNDNTPLFADDQSKLRDLNLPIYTYAQMIEGLKSEIHEFLKR